MSRKTMTAALLRAADTGTKQYAGEIRRLLATAQKANKQIDCISNTDAQAIGMGDTMERLRRNAAALQTLLSMAADASEYINAEITAIFRVCDRMDEEKAARQKALLDQQNH